jgi:hypothetical protein
MIMHAAAPAAPQSGSLRRVRNARGDAAALLAWRAQLCRQWGHAYCQKCARAEACTCVHHAAVKLRAVCHHAAQAATRSAASAQATPGYQREASLADPSWPLAARALPPQGDPKNACGP